jgi:hypothetical protein
LTKNLLGYILGDFLQAHLVTLLVAYVLKTGYLLLAHPEPKST